MKEEVDLIIFGIDPGTRFTGYGVLIKKNQTIQCLDWGVIRLPEKESLEVRLLKLGEDLLSLFKKYSPDFVAIEKIFLGKNADSAFKLGHARGVAMYAALVAQAKVMEYSTREVKKGITGTGASEKEQVMLVLQRLLRLPNLNQLDASDALALAYHHCVQMDIQSKMIRLREA